MIGPEQASESCIESDNTYKGNVVMNVISPEQVEISGDYFSGLNPHKYNRYNDKHFIPENNYNFERMNDITSHVRVRKNGMQYSID